MQKKYVLVKLNLILVNYSKEAVHERIRPNPDVCKLVTIAELSSLSKEVITCDLLEETFKTTRAAFEGPLITATSSLRASGYIHDFEMQSTRLALGKAPLLCFHPGCPSGKLNEEKMHIVQDAWVKYLQAQVSHINIYEATGYKPHQEEAAAEADEASRTNLI